MVARPKKLRWSGSIAALREHEQALREHPPQPKKKGGKAKKRHPVPVPKRVPYAEYLASPWWKNKRQQKLKAANHQCQRCGSRERLQVHHLHYRTLWREKNSDLEVLCRRCHEIEHECLVQAKSHLRSINGQ